MSWSTENVTVQVTGLGAVWTLTDTGYGVWAMALDTKFAYKAFSNKKSLRAMAPLKPSLKLKPVRCTLLRLKKRVQRTRTNLLSGRASPGTFHWLRTGTTTTRSRLSMRRIRILALWSEIRMMLIKCCITPMLFDTRLLSRSRYPVASHSR